MRDGYAKLRLLLWKDCKKMTRHPLRSLGEILIPVIFCVLIVLLRKLGEVEVHDEITRYPEYPAASFMLKNYSGIRIAWTTAGGSYLFKTLANTVMERAFGAQFKTMFLQSPEELFDTLKNPKATDLLRGRKIICGIIFDGRETFQQICSRRLKITVRFPGDLRSMSGLSPYENWQTDYLFPQIRILGPRDPQLRSGPLPSYFREFFILIQLRLGREILVYCQREMVPTPPDDLTNLERTAVKHPVLLNLHSRLRRFSYIPYSKDILLPHLRTIVPLLIMMAFYYHCLTITKLITQEKETQMKELMKIMGLPSLLHWIAWFIIMMTNLLISCLIITIMLQIEWIRHNAVFGHSDFTLVFTFFALYMVALTCFCFMVTSFCNKESVAAVVAGLMWFLFHVPHFFMVSGYRSFSLKVKIPLALFLNVAMAFGVEILLFGEGSTRGVKWSNVCLPAHSAESITLCHCMMMLLLDAVIYLLICVYVEAVYPGMYGVPKSWYFFFQKRHWLGTQSRKKNSLQAEPANYDVVNFENEPSLPAGIQLQNMRKIFAKTKIAVSNMSLNMYEGQITVLLGHNGAGKTTTMSVITGMYSPTSGKAIVNGYDVAYDTKRARQSLGLCPQNNVLFEDLTVYEHFYFFAKLKGMNKTLIKDEITRFVVMLQLQPKEHNLTKTLSGGMMRKLNTGIALCGNTKVVLLDEPSSGMDPAARRAIWDMLILEKEGRTVLLSTHFMEEADVLGDRIAIMSAGILKCCGSTFFLKKQFGMGYRLVIEKGLKCDTDEVTDLLSYYISGIKPSIDIGSELVYQLKETNVTVFETMFEDFQNSCSRLGVLSFGLSLSTLEEVFLNTGVDKELASVETKKDSTANTYDTESDDMQYALVSGCELQCYRIQALIFKKFIVYRRGWLVFFIHLLFPVIFITSILSVQLQFHVNINQGPHTISLKSYDKKIVAIAISSNSRADTHDNIGPKYFYKSYKRYVRENKGTLVDLGYAENPREVVEKHILRKMKNDIDTTRQHYLVGASIEPGHLIRVVLWYNDLPLHTAALTMSLALNALLRNFDCGITFINHPLPLSPESQATMNAIFSNASKVAPIISLAMAFVTAYFIQFIIRERVCKNKHLQYVSGINPFMFWAVHFIWDGILFLLPCLTTIFTLMIFQKKGYDTVDDWGRIFLILMLFGWAMLPYIYCVSFLFTVPATGYGRMVMIHMFTGCAAFLVISVFRLLHLAEDAVNILEWFFYFTPHYCLAHAIHNSFLNHIYHDLCTPVKDNCDKVDYNPCCPGKCPEEGCVQYQENYFAMEVPGIGTNLLILFFFGIIFMVVLFLIECRLFQTCWEIIEKKFIKKIGKEEDEEEAIDSDVLAEKQKILKGDMEDLGKIYCLILRNVTKYYGSFLAVDHICVGVPKGECFGLLGSNGAGKTTIFKMMTGDLTMSEGNVFVEGFNIQENKKKVQQMMGYCPQFDAVLSEMTGWETLNMFCLIRGIYKSDIGRTSKNLATRLLLTAHMSKQLGKYSGGNKRKMSSAIALIGRPSVVFLDEPTTGMDPEARRNLWNVICSVRDFGTSIILTSHSMDECEALCTRVAIQVNGRFKCLGSLQHLKNKFAQGFSLQVKVVPMETHTINPPTLRRETAILFAFHIEPVKYYIEYYFPGAILNDEYMGVLSYSIPATDLTWSQMFGLMETAKMQYDIEDYYIGQTNLEQVFLSFTMKQKTEDDLE